MGSSHKNTDRNKSIYTDDRERDTCKIEKFQRIGNVQGCGLCDF